MVRYIETKGRKLAVAFSLRQAFALCSKHNTDLDGLVEKLSVLKLDEPSYELLLDLGVLGLNTGAEREGTTERFTADDVDDIFTHDLGALRKIIEAFITSLQGEEVFQKATTEAPKSPKKRGAK